MDESRVLLVGFEDKIDIYDIAENPLSPKLKARSREWSMSNKKIIKLNEE